MTEIEKLAEEIKEAIASNMVASTRNAIASDWVYDLNITTRKVLEIIEGYKASSSNTGDGLRWVKSEIEKKMNGYFDKSFKAQQRIDKGDKNAGVLEKCEKEYSARGLELSWVLELFKKAETNPVDNIIE